jgi:hypothetical protein
VEKPIESVGKEIIQNGTSPVQEGGSEVSADALGALPLLISNSSTRQAVDEAVLPVPDAGGKSEVLSPDDIEESPGRKKLRTVFILFYSSLSSIYSSTLGHNSLTSLYTVRRGRFETGYYRWTNESPPNSELSRP